VGTKKKILFVGHYREPNNSGWGKLARQEMELLNDHTDLVTRSVDLAHQEDIPIWITEAENKSIEGVTTVIQYVLPNFFQRIPNVKNILWVELETNDIRYSLWPEYMNMADEIWVPNEDAKQCLLNTKSVASFIPIKVIPHRIKPAFPEELPLQIPNLEGNYNFYTISTATHRKNLEDLIAAFHTEFDPNEPVNLIIKTTQDLNELYKTIKDNLKLYQNIHDYKEEMTLTRDLTDSQISGLHCVMDCFVSASHGEGWCIPAYEAAQLGKNVIAPFYGGTKKLMELFPDENSFHSVTGTSYAGGAIPNYQNGWDTWNCPDQKQIRQSMRFVFENRKNFEPVNLSDFNDENHIKNLLENIE